MITDKLAHCVRRAQDLDDRDPQRRALLGQPPVLAGLGYTEERELFRVAVQVSFTGRNEVIKTRGRMIPAAM